MDVKKRICPFTSFMASRTLRIPSSPLVLKFMPQWVFCARWLLLYAQIYLFTWVFAFCLCVPALCHEFLNAFCALAKWILHVLSQLLL